jgi:AraC-like DNA-binding protein
MNPSNEKVPPDAPRQAAAPSAVPTTTASAAWQQLAGPFAVVPALIHQLGADPQSTLAAAGLSEDAFAGPNARAPFASIACLLSEAAARTSCAHFGLLVGRACHLSDLGTPGELLRHAPTVGRGLTEFVVHHRLNSEGAVVFLMERAGVVDLGYAIYDPLARGTFQIYDAAIATASNMLREVCGENFRPTEVLFAHARPVDVAPYRQCFRAPVRFNAELSSIRFPASMLAQPIKGADPDRFRRALAVADAATRAHLAQAAHRALRMLLLHGKASGEDVAQELAMHRRTLNRRLAAEGTTFQKVLDHVRRTVATELLEDSDVAMHDIAESLGYSGLTPFMRAFRRWTGRTPGEWRKAARASDARE